MVLFLQKAGKPPDSSLVQPHEMTETRAVDAVELFRTKVSAVGVCIQVGVPFLLIGAPGTAKTAIVEALFRRLCKDHHTSIPSLHDPSYYVGYPSRARKDGNHVAVMLPNDWLVRLSQCTGRTGLFLDELSSAPPATRAACLRGLLEGAWGDHRLPNCSSGAAMNPPELAEAGYELSAPLANRFAHFEWNPPARWWDEQRSAGFRDPEVPLLPNDWRKHIHQATALHGGFVMSRPQLIQACPEEAQLQCKAWPSFRTWTWACELLGAAASVGAGFHSDLSSILVSSVVGAGPAREFLTYCSAIDLPDPESLLKDPSLLSLPRRGDQAYACLMSVVAATLSNNTAQRWEAAWDVLGFAMDELQRPDVACAAARMLATNRPEGYVGVPRAMKKFVPFLQQCGILSQ